MNSFISLTNVFYSNVYWIAFYSNIYLILCVSTWIMDRWIEPLRRGERRRERMYGSCTASQPGGYAW
jgi:hypothetical protein